MIHWCAYVGAASGQQLASDSAEARAALTLYAVSRHISLMQFVFYNDKFSKFFFGLKCLIYLIKAYVSHSSCSTQIGVRAFFVCPCVCCLAVCVAATAVASLCDCCLVIRCLALCIMNLLV